MLTAWTIDEEMSAEEEGRVEKGELYYMEGQTHKKDHVGSVVCVTC